MILGIPPCCSSRIIGYSAILIGIAAQAAYIADKQGGALKQVDAVPNKEVQQIQTTCNDYAQEGVGIIL